MNKLIIILFVFLNFAIQAQESLRIAKVEHKYLSNGIEVFLLKDTNQTNLYLSVYCSYRPITTKYYAGIDKVFAFLTGGRILMDSIYAKTLIINKKSLDSALHFIRYQVFERQFNEKEFEKAKIFIKNNSTQLYDNIARIINYPRDYPLDNNIPEYMQAKDLMSFRYRFSAKKTTVILVGNYSDSAYIMIDSLIGGMKFQTHEFTPVRLRRNTPKGLYFVNKHDTIFSVGFVQGFRLKKPIDIIFYEFFHNLLKVVYPQGKSILKFSSLGSYQAYFIPTQEIVKEVKNFEKRIENPIHDLSKEDIYLIGQKMRYWLDSIVSSPWGFTDIVYYIYKSNENLEYLSKLRQTLSNLDASKIETLLVNLLKEKKIPVIIGNELLVGCQILNLTNDYDISFVDRKIYKYKVIKKGFNAWTVINRYISFVSPYRTIKNLTYNFDGVFFVDSSFFYFKGYVWKKAPNLYRYQTFIITDKDTLFHYLLLYDGYKWLDSSALGSKILDSVQMSIAQKRAYILGELYYKELGYNPKILCDPELLANNLYKIRVRANNVYFDEVYDMSTGRKMNTSIKRGQDWIKSFYYYDYTRVSKGKNDFKIPFTVVEQTYRYTMVQELRKVSFHTISKKIFTKDYYFYPGKKRKSGLLNCISRCIKKIQKFCIF